VKLVALVQEIMDGPASPTRRRARKTATSSTHPRFGKGRGGKPALLSADEVTGMFISLMFAGHHTKFRDLGVDADRVESAHRNVYAEVLAEARDVLYADGQEVSFPCAAPDSEAGQRGQGDPAAACIRRLIILIGGSPRVSSKSRGFGIHDGDFVAASTGDLEPDSGGLLSRPGRPFNQPDRYNNKPEQADVVNRWTWIPFGAGRGTVAYGAAFATMQYQGDLLKFLLREYEFEMDATGRQLSQRPLTRWS